MESDHDTNIYVSNTQNGYFPAAGQNRSIQWSIGPFTLSGTRWNSVLSKKYQGVFTDELQISHVNYSDSILADHIDVEFVHVIRVFDQLISYICAEIYLFSWLPCVNSRVERIATCWQFGFLHRTWNDCKDFATPQWLLRSLWPLQPACIWHLLLDDILVSWNNCILSPRVWSS